MLYKSHSEFIENSDPQKNQLCLKTQEKINSSDLSIKLYDQDIEISNDSDLNKDDSKKSNYLMTKTKKQKFCFCSCLYLIFEKLFGILGSFFPKSKMNLPLNFRKSQYFSSKRITFFSILVVIFVSYNTYKNILQIGQIQSYITSTLAISTNFDLSKEFQSIKLRKYLEVDYQNENLTREAFLESQVLPYMDFSRIPSNFSCDYYNQMNFKEQIYKMNIQFFNYFAPLKCKKFDKHIYLFVDPHIGQYILKRYVEEYENQEFISLEEEEKNLLNYNVTYAKSINQKFPVRYRIDMNEFCTGKFENMTYDFFVNNNQINYKYLPQKDKEDQLFTTTNQFIEFPQTGSYFPCSKNRESNNFEGYQRQIFFQKSIVVKPLNILQSFYQLFTFSKQNLVFYLSYEKDNTKNLLYPSSQPMIEEDFLFIGSNQMIKTDIQSFTLSKALSAIGGFVSLSLMIYGFLTSFFLPRIFITKLSIEILNKKINRNLERKIQFKDSQNLNDMKQEIQEMLSFEHFVELNYQFEKKSEEIEILQQKISYFEDFIKNLQQNQNEKNIQQAEEKQELELRIKKLEIQFQNTMKKNV